ncbi:MAG: metal-dependent hydrolase [Clostridiales bacterium]|nr:metal-dependent hydrolase [Clostridiales bacterium]
MLIDFHTHIFPDKIAKSTIDALASNAHNTPYTDGTVQGMIDAMARADADICITLPVLTKPTQFESVLKFAISVNERFANEKKRLISFAGMHPKCEDIDGKMALIKASGIKGVKIHPDYQSTFIDDKGYIDILKCAKKYDLIVVTHSGVDDGYEGEPVRCPPERVKKVIEEVGHSKFVLAHYGAHKQWQNVLDLLCGLDVYFDTAYTLHEIDSDLFKSILEKHGEDKILFATDCPWQDICDNANRLKSLNLSQQTLDKLFYKNALKLLDL